MSRYESAAAGWRGAFVLAVVAAAIFSFSSAAQSSDRQEGRGFLGLWEGTDPLYGSTVRLSISNLDDDDVFEILWGESFFTVCFEIGQDYSLRRGLITAHGGLVDPDLLEVEAIQTCINDVLVISSGVAEFPDIPLHRVAK